MKKTFKSVVFTAVLSVLLLAGCSNVLTNASVSGGDVKETAPEEYKMLTIIAETTDKSILKLPTEPASSRNIQGDALKGSQLSFFLFTKKKGATSYSAPTEAVAFTAATGTVGSTNDVELNSGTIKINLEDAYYDFILFAVQTDKIPAEKSLTNLKSAATLMGITQAELRDSSTKVHFVLRPDGLSGQSIVQINLATENWVSSDFDIVSSIQKLTSSEAITGGSNTLTVTTIPNITENFATAFDGDTTYEYKSGSVDPGTYNFVVAFTQKTGGRTFYYSELIDILPNYSFTANVLIPEIVMFPPAAPTNFYVGFLDPAVTSSETYKVGFSWDDNSNNEAFFQLELLTLDGADDSAVVEKDLAINTPWGTTTDDTNVTDTSSYAYTTLGYRGSKSLERFGADFAGDTTQHYAGGSLIKNNKCAVLRLELGKRYLARICAVNDAGKSAYTYVTLGTAPTISYTDLASDGGASVTATFNRFDTDTKVINRYRLAYNLNGGTATLADASASTADIVEYRTQNAKTNSGEGKADTDGKVTPGTYVGSKIETNVDKPSCDIWNPSYDTTTYKSLKSGDRPWFSWRYDDGTSSPSVDYPGTRDGEKGYNPVDYKGYKNLLLIANYTVDTADVILMDPTDYNITPSMIDVTVGATTTNIATKSRVDFDATSETTAIIKVKLTDRQQALGINYDSVTVNIKAAAGNVDKGTYKLTYDSTNKYWSKEINASTFNSVKYNVTVTGYSAKMASDGFLGAYNKTFVLNVTE